MSNEAVCRTAPATPGLLIRKVYFYWLKGNVNDYYGKNTRKRSIFPKRISKMSEFNFDLALAYRDLPATIPMTEVLQNLIGCANV